MNRDSAIESLKHVEGELDAPRFALAKIFSSLIVGAGFVAPSRTCRGDGRRHGAILRPQCGHNLRGAGGDQCVECGYGLAGLRRGGGSSDPAAGRTGPGRSAAA